MADAQSEAAQLKVKVRAAAQYLSALAALAEMPKQLEEASANLKQKLVPKLGFDGEVDWRVIADERVKGGLIVEAIERDPTSRPRE